jgi:hypothetical protein
VTRSVGVVGDIPLVLRDVFVDVKTCSGTVVWHVCEFEVCLGWVICSVYVSVALRFLYGYDVEFFDCVVVEEWRHDFLP